jgi:hypothetical protein
MKRSLIIKFNILLINFVEGLSIIVFVGSNVSDDFVDCFNLFGYCSSFEAFIDYHSNSFISFIAL